MYKTFARGKSQGCSSSRFPALNYVTDEIIIADDDYNCVIEGRERERGSTTAFRCNDCSRIYILECRARARLVVSGLCTDAFFVCQVLNAHSAERFRKRGEINLHEK